MTHARIWQLRWSVANYTNQNQAKFLKDGKWTLPETVLADAAKAQGLDGTWLKDAWGKPLKLVKLDKKRTDPQGQPQFEQYDIVSAGPDGKLGTDDDVKLSTAPVNPWRFAQVWWDDAEEADIDGLGAVNRNGMNQWGMMRRGRLRAMAEVTPRRSRDGAFGGRFPQARGHSAGGRRIAGRVGGFPLDDKAKDAKPGIGRRRPGRRRRRRRGCANTSPRRCCGSRASSPTTRAAPRCR